MADRNRPTALLCTLAVLSLSLGALGQEIPLGSEFQINTYTVGYQLIPAVALGPDGAFIVAWLNEGAASSFFIFARRFSSAGVPLASEFQVNSYTLNFLSVVAAAADADGDAIVVWSQHLGGPYHLFARRFSSVGSPLTGELQVNSHTIQGWGPLPVVASDAAGNFVVVWHDRRSQYEDVFARRFSSSGTALTSELQVNSSTLVWQPFPAVAAEADGDFVVAWKGIASFDEFYYPTYRILARRFASTGAPLIAEFQVSSHTLSYFSHPAPAVASGAEGDFVVVWNGSDTNGSNAGIFARLFSSAGASVGTEFQVNTYSGFRHESPAAAADADGDFVVAWNSYGQDGSRTGVFARRFSRTGAPLTNEFQVNTYTAEGQFVFRSVAAEADGDFIVAWSSQTQDGSDWGAFAQRFVVPTATPTATATVTPTPTRTGTSTPTATATIKAPYEIPTLSRGAMVILALLLMTVCLAFLLLRMTGER